MRILSPYFCALVFAGASFGAVTSVELVERTDYPGLPYEHIVAKVHFAVDPKLPANRIIADIDLAPRNAQGLVDFQRGPGCFEAARFGQGQRYGIV